MENIEANVNPQPQVEATSPRIEQLKQQIMQEKSPEAKAPEPQIDDGLLADEPQDWYINEATKGEGDRPAWLRNKYKTVEAQAKAYDDLEKKLGSFKGAPEVYNYDDDIGVSSDNEAVRGFENVAKKLNLSQDGFKEIVKYFAKEVIPTISGSEPTIDVRREREKLGEVGLEKSRRLTNWLKNKLPADKYVAVKNSIKTAEAVEAMFDIMSSANENILPKIPSYDAVATAKEVDPKKAFREAISKVMSSGDTRKINEVIASFQGKL